MITCSMYLKNNVHKRHTLKGKYHVYDKDKGFNIYI